MKIIDGVLYAEKMTDCEVMLCSGCGYRTESGCEIADVYHAIQNDNSLDEL